MHFLHPTWATGEGLYILQCMHHPDVSTRFAKLSQTRCVCLSNCQARSTIHEFWIHCAEIMGFHTPQHAIELVSHIPPSVTELTLGVTQCTEDVLQVIASRLPHLRELHLAAANFEQPFGEETLQDIGVSYQPLSPSLCSHVDVNTKASLRSPTETTTVVRGRCIGRYVCWRYCSRRG